ncbi:hypothetical protein Tco_0820041 [Tanacetum coccineum]|uniref:Uncharacterized protein n=1 Tax=Tanacetum coccineum TaxID=301880 RepID=A0ABQ5ABB5_9ASTR
MKNSWSGKKRSSDEGSRGMDQGWYCKANAVSDLDLQSSSSEEGRRHLEDVHRLQEWVPSDTNVRGRQRENNLLHRSGNLLLCQDAIRSEECKGNLPKAGRFGFSSTIEKELRS